MRRALFSVLCLTILGFTVFYSSARATSQIYDFSPNPNGFGFHNYGGGFPNGDLTIDDVYAIFGDQVCATVKDNTCTPTPNALLWIDSMNGYMLNGHCVGFTVTSYQFLMKQLQQSTFEPQATTTFALQQNDMLMHTIAKNYVYQMFEEVYKATIDGAPKTVLDKLIALNAPADLGIFSKSNDGHSLLAYNVEDKGNSVYWIRVYDSNAPGKDAYIEVNKKANTWKYFPPESAPSSNPDDWQGDKKSNSLIFTPLSAYALPPICPFCKTDGSNSQATQGPKGNLSTPTGSSLINYVTLTGGNANLLLTNTSSQRLGQSSGELVNEIPGAYLIRLPGGLASPGILLSLPSDQDYILQINSGSGTNANDVDIRSLGNGFYFSVDGLNIAQPLQETISISNTSKTIQYTASGEQHPTLKMAFSIGDVTYLIAMGDADMTSGNAFSLGIDPLTGELSLSLSGLQDGTISLAFARIEEGNVQVFASNQVQLGVNGTGTLDLSSWNGQNLLSLAVDINNDGTMDQIDPLTNQNLGNLLEAGQSASEIISEFGEFPPYLNEAENQAFINNLLDIGLTGRDLGKVFYKFNEFGMNLQDLSQFIIDHFSNLYDIAGFLYELHLSSGTLDQFLNTLPSEWQSYLQGQIAMFDKLANTLYEGEYQGYSGPNLINFIKDSLFNPFAPLLLATPNAIPTLPPSLVIPPWMVPPEPPNLPIIGSNPFLGSIP